MYSVPCRSFYANKEYYEEYSKQLLTNTLYICLGLNNYGFVITKPLLYTFDPSLLEDLPESLYKRRDILKGSKMTYGVIEIVNYSSASTSLSLEFDLVLESALKNQEAEFHDNLSQLISYYLPEVSLSQKIYGNKKFSFSLRNG